MGNFRLRHQSTKSLRVENNQAFIVFFFFFFKIKETKRDCIVLCFISQLYIRGQIQLETQTNSLTVIIKPTKKID